MRPILGAIFVAVVALAAVGVVFAMAGDDEAAAYAAADLVPADTHLFVGFNLDLTSEPWVALPRLLDALGVEQEARDDFNESLAEEDLDYEEDLVPIIGNITALAIAARALDLDEGDGVFAIATRDVNGFTAFVERTAGDDVTVSTTNDSLSGLKFTDFFERDADSQISLTTRDGVVYLGFAPNNSGAREAVISHLERLEIFGPLSESPEFVEMFGQSPGTSLIAVWVSGAAIDAIADRDLRDQIQTIEDEAEIDLSSFRLALSFFVETEGFRIESVARMSSFGSIAPFVTGVADIDAAAALVPAGALYFQAQTGLGTGIEALFDAVEEADNADTADVLSGLDQIEQDSGVDLILDLAQNMSGTQFFALGNLVGYPDPTGIEYILFGTQANDVTQLRNSLVKLLEYVEEALCVCDTDVAVDIDGDFVRIYWPAAEALPHFDEPALADDPAFRRMVALLPDEPTFLLYFNIAALPQGVFDDAAEDSDVNLAAIGGFGVAATQVDERTIRISAVIPITTE